MVSSLNSSGLPVEAFRSKLTRPMTRSTEDRSEGSGFAGST